MHHKNIKIIVRKQLKKQHPNWNRLNRKTKKEIARKVLAETVSDYDFSRDVVTQPDELLGIEQQVPTNGIINLKEMAHMIDKVNNNRVIRFSDFKRSCKYIKDQELYFIDKLIDDGIINYLLSYEGYSPAMHDIFPSNFRPLYLKEVKVAPNLPSWLIVTSPYSCKKSPWLS